MSFFDMLALFYSNNNDNAILKGLWGLEKESLRITENGDLALTPHPAAFGDKLENPFITTDFSESQIELVTPPHNSMETAFFSLAKIQDHAGKALKDEYFWPFSMPSRLPADEYIPIAQFNRSKEGLFAELYRRGLATRYGKKMQMISGIHYNFSFHADFWTFLHRQLQPAMDKQMFINEYYFRLARNYIRNRWLLIYLFGASPWADESFATSAQEFNYIQQYADSSISLRMSPFGYSADRQTDVHISYDNLHTYIRDLEIALQTESNVYKTLGLYRNGIRTQLNTRLLQKDSEFYSSIRLKADARKGQSHLERLKAVGVRYLEIRSVDLNPFYYTGVSLQQLYFYHLFLIYCLFSESDLITETEMAQIHKNDTLVALEGRKEGLLLFKPDGSSIGMVDWAEQIFARMLPIVALLEYKNPTGKYLRSYMYQKKKFANQALLPAWKIVYEMKHRKETYIEFGTRKARQFLARDQFAKRFPEYGTVNSNPD